MVSSSSIVTALHDFLMLTVAGQKFFSFHLFLAKNMNWCRAVTGPFSQQTCKLGMVVHGTGVANNIKDGFIPSESWHSGIDKDPEKKQLSRILSSLVSLFNTCAFTAGTCQTAFWEKGLWLKNHQILYIHLFWLISYSRYLLRLELGRIVLDLQILTELAC